MFKLFQMFIVLSFLSLFLTSCSVRTAQSPFGLDDTDNMSPGLRSDTADVGSGLDSVDLMNSSQKMKYDSLKKKKAKLEEQIDGLERERLAIQVQQIQPIGNIEHTGGLAQARSNSGADLTIDGDRNIDRLKWQSESVANQLKSLKTELGLVESDIDSVKSETKKTCFPSNTKILLANGSNKEISKIKKGDLVMVYDAGKDEISASKVNKIFISDNNHMYVINSSIHATAYERFLTQDKGWLKIRDLRVGEKIFNGNSYGKIDKIDKILKKQKVYNLNIISQHNFFVSNDGNKYFLIHNSSGGHGGGGSGGGGGK